MRQGKDAGSNDNPTSPIMEGSGSRAPAQVIAIAKVVHFPRRRLSFSLYFELTHFTIVFVSSSFTNEGRVLMIAGFEGHQRALELARQRHVNGVLVLHPRI